MAVILGRYSNIHDKLVLRWVLNHALEQMDKELQNYETVLLHLQKTDFGDLVAVLNCDVVDFGFDSVNRCQMPVNTHCLMRCIRIGIEEALQKLL